jgi:MYXO-CTERM domain-containing protein
MSALFTRRIARTAALILAFAAFGPHLARADVLPMDWCNADSVGKPCDHAGPHWDQPGICAATTCSHRVFPCDASGDKPCAPATYPCGHCTLDPAAVAAPGPAGTDGGVHVAVVAPGATVAPPASGKKGICAVSAVGGPSRGSGLALCVGAIALAGAIRRRRKGLP